MNDKTKAPRSVSAWLLFVALSIGFAQVCGAANDKKLDKALDRSDAAAVAKIVRENGAQDFVSRELLSRAWSGDAKAVALLLDAGVTGESLNERALANAARSGSVEVATLLIDRGAKLNWQARAFAIRPNAPGWIPPTEPGVEYANLGPFDVPEGKLAHLKLTVVESGGHSALSLAVANKKPDVVRLLLAKGADEDLVVIHRDPEFEALNMLGEAGRQAILDGDGGNMVLNSRSATGRQLTFINDGGVIKTNAPFAFEKKSSIRELAKSIGDEAISSQF